MIWGIEAPQRVINRGFRSSAALTASAMMTLSSPITAVISSRPETNIRLSESYHRGSSWVV